MLGVDAGFLYMETPTLHMHTLKVALLETPQAFDFDLLSAQLMTRLHRLPPLLRRALPVPLALNHPVWIADAAIDPGRHLFHQRIPAPGTMRELETVIGTIASTPLDRSVPLWEMHLCEGLADGRTAVVAKVHHALADGIAANALLANVTDAVVGAALVPVPDPPLEPTPGRAALVRSALVDAVRQLAAVPGLVRRTAAAIRVLVRHKRTSSVATPRPILDVPKVSFNGAISARRLFATCSLPLEAIKAVRKAAAVSVNDVVLAVVAGALRSWLDARGEHRSGPLIAGVPVGTHDPAAEPRLGGNQVSNLFTSLGTDIADPVQRLAEISRVTAEAKIVQRTLGPDMLADWVQFTPPGPFSLAMRAYSRLHAASWHRPPFNVIVSNVPGPREPVTIGGAALSDLYSVGPILEGIGLNVTAWSYVGSMNFSLLTCPELLADLRPLADGFAPALEELLTATEAIA